MSSSHPFHPFAFSLCFAGPGFASAHGPDAAQLVQRRPQPGVRGQGGRVARPLHARLTRRSHHQVSFVENEAGPGEKERSTLSYTMLAVRWDLGDADAAFSCVSVCGVCVPQAVLCGGLRLSEPEPQDPTGARPRGGVLGTHTHAIPTIFCTNIGWA